MALMAVDIVLGEQEAMQETVALVVEPEVEVQVAAVLVGARPPPALMVRVRGVEAHQLKIVVLTAPIQQAVT